MDERLAAADPSFFTIFSFPFIQGDPKTALQNRHSIVITQSLAQGVRAGAMGRVMSISDTDMTVTGVIRDIPAQSHPSVSTYAFPAVNMAAWRESQLDAWDYTQFARLPPAASRRPPEDGPGRRPSSSAATSQGPGAGSPAAPDRCPSRFHRHQHLDGEVSRQGEHRPRGRLPADRRGVLLLKRRQFHEPVHRPARRASQEVAVRKVVGAGRPDLFRHWAKRGLKH